MNDELLSTTENRNHFEHVRVPLRVLGIGSPALDADSSWYFVNSNVDSIGAITGLGADCCLVDTGSSDAIALAAVSAAGLPLVVAVSGDGGSAGGWHDGLAALIDAADGYVLPGDSEAVVAAVLADAVAADSVGLRVADLSDGTARTMQALSLEASRIAEQLSALAAQEAALAAPVRAIDAALIRRMIKLRRDRERFFPAEIFADPAWDMLLDLIAAQLEYKRVPVSSLCIAAAVPTTTALRWIRSLTEAGLLVRRLDSQDARRSHVELSDTAATAMLGYLRLFSDQFAMR
jgi:hypothetical protein